jgi:hypothetical protein
MNRRTKIRFEEKRQAVASDIYDAHISSIWLMFLGSIEMMMLPTGVFQI